MTLNEYQEQAMKTCMRESDNFAYMMLNLFSEVGEFAGKIAKAIRKGRMNIGAKDVEIDSANTLTFHLEDDEDVQIIIPFEDDLRKEAGDILWQLAGLCKVMGWELEDIAQQNLEKLASRKKRGVIDGDGDNR